MMLVKYKNLMDVIIWMLFIKSILIILATLYLAVQIFFFSTYSPFIGIASCAAGTFALSMTSLAIWLRHKLS